MEKKGYLMSKVYEKVFEKYLEVYGIKDSRDYSNLVKKMLKPYDNVEFKKLPSIFQFNKSNMGKTITNIEIEFERNLVQFWRNRRFTLGFKKPFDFYVEINDLLDILESKWDEKTRKDLFKDFKDEILSDCKNSRSLESDLDEIKFDSDLLNDLMKVQVDQRELREELMKLKKLLKTKGRS